MALLENGALRADDWVLVADDAPLPDAPALVSATRLAEAATRNAPLGVALAPAESPDLIAAHLPRLSVVQVTLPGPRDGRAFTQIRSLREYHGFTGEIRVAGHVIPDHYAKLLRCGAITVVVKDALLVVAIR
jgi:uncharacterized protein (DUF934 family)